MAYDIYEGHTESHVQNLTILIFIFKSNQVHHLNLQTFLSLFNIISIFSAHIFPSFCKFENTFAIEFHSSCLQTLTHRLPNILQHLIVVAMHLFLNRTKKMVVWDRTWNNCVGFHGHSLDCLGFPGIAVSVLKLFLTFQPSSRGFLQSWSVTQVVVLVPEKHRSSRF